MNPGLEAALREEPQDDVAHITRLILGERDACDWTSTLTTIAVFVARMREE